MKIFFALFASFFIQYSNAQLMSADSSRFKALLFDNFHDGYVLLKSGDIEQAPLNYNTDDQSIYFQKEGRYMVLGGLETIDTIYFQHKKFVPVKNLIYEVVSDPSSTGIVFVSYSNKTRPLSATADHNGTSNQTANQVSNTITNTYANGIMNTNRSVEIQKHYWMEKNKKLYKADNVKQVAKIFPSHSNDIEKFVAENNINFILDSDLIKLAEFCKNKN
jgi:hypothetical protein